LLARGRILFDHDPVEWGATALELLYRTLVRANPAAGVWLRRQVVVHLSTRMLRAVDAHMTRVRVEQLTDPQAASAPVPRLPRRRRSRGRRIGRGMPDSGVAPE
jgi:hypothetical protein